MFTEVHKTILFGLMTIAFRSTACFYKSGFIGT